ncbi:hypothetical protein PHAVU_002G322300 [Phaseolus vulgaris]|uniref:Response regulatory domain-containing protein n=1 Tax=Phaseolus vulgaris TaxID=3885 RepID=V7CQP2_PHAVU|nr:hypothetical protein PHAVU_002G322300g [Phaseolus vulgaris]ESW32434.1 hypothetical protein PHAVU_002G322300g [Phaseolus vulgaris]
MAENSSPAIDTHRTLRFSSMLNVLVIDTNLSVLEYIKQACTHYSYQVIPCSESLSAANFLRERKELIHLILIEAHMPLMDGYEFLQFVKQEQINVPLIMMSTDDSDASVMNAIEVGACDYWIKPLEKNRIVSMWTHVVKNSMSKDKKRKDIGCQKDYDRTRVMRYNSEFASSLVDFDVDESKNANPPSRKTKRVVWSTELHDLFLNAMKKAGEEAMNVPGLERGHVASHLQKHTKSLTEKQQKEMSLASWNTEPERIHLQSSTSLTDFHHPGFTGNMGPKGEQHFHAEEALAHHHHPLLATFSNMAIAENSPQFMRNIRQQYHHKIHPINFDYNSGINMDNGLASLQSIKGGNNMGEVILNQDTTKASVYHPQSQNAGLSSCAVRSSDAIDIDDATSEEQLILSTME